MIQYTGEYKFLQIPGRLHKAICLCIEQILSDTEDMKEIQTKFQMKMRPTLSISAYLERIFKYINCSPIVFVMALILIDRVQESHQDFYMTYRNAHRLMITAVVLATKYYDDFYFKNTFYAKLGGIPTNVLNEMEEELLDMLNYDCFISEATLKSYLERLEVFSLLNSQNQK